MKKLLFIFAFLLILPLIASCEFGSGPSDTGYWFSSHSYKYVEFDQSKDNISEAGSYWYFTAKKSMHITMYVGVNVDKYYSNAKLYVNDTEVTSESNTGIYKFAYDLNLEKGDKITLYAYWNYSVLSSYEEFSIYTLCINDGTQTYVIKEFDKTTTS